MVKAFYVSWIPLVVFFENFAKTNGCWLSLMGSPPPPGDRSYRGHFSAPGRGRFVGRIAWSYVKRRMRSSSQFSARFIAGCGRFEKDAIFERFLENNANISGAV